MNVADGMLEGIQNLSTSDSIPTRHMKGGEIFMKELKRMLEDLTFDLKPKRATVGLRKYKPNS